MHHNGTSRKVYKKPSEDRCGSAYQCVLALSSFFTTWLAASHIPPNFADQGFRLDAADSRSKLKSSGATTNASLGSQYEARAISSKLTEADDTKTVTSRAVQKVNIIATSMATSKTASFESCTGSVGDAIGTPRTR